MTKYNDIDYSEFVGIVRERNRPSGGIRTVHTIAVAAFLGPNSKVIEIGSNTGFTCVNLSLLTGCSAVGVDVNKDSVREAIEYARTQGVKDKVVFLEGNALKLPAESESFDLVWASNVTSFINNKEAVIREYLRVLKPGGFLAVVPIYYIKNPPKKIRTQVSKAIGVDVGFTDKKYWSDLFTSTAEDAGIHIELCHEQDYKYLDVGSRIKAYVDMLLSKQHLQELSTRDKRILEKKARALFSLFNTNLKYAGYSILLFQKRRHLDEIELFLTHVV